jgi:hypothetical protein
MYEVSPAGKTSSIIQIKDASGDFFGVYACGRIPESKIENLKGISSYI